MNSFSRTWSADEDSLLVNGERIFLYSGEFHPFRLPVPSLWIDVFEKIKAFGFNTVSFYTDWALLEGKPGEYRAEGVFDFEPFLKAAKEAGIYLIARPGPYINAETSGGGFPGWLQRNKDKLRTSALDFLAATDNYMSHVCSTIAKHQITNGVILVQPENEYTFNASGILFPDGPYMQYVLDQIRNAGIVVPLVSNDASPRGHNAPGSGVGEVDIYGHDSYPISVTCKDPYIWPAGNLSTRYWSTHLQQSPETPFSIIEFQGGVGDPWGGYGYEQCQISVNEVFERVIYKNNYANGIKIMNLYMLYGGTNWGNLGYASSYTSYDVGSAIKEDRTIAREKYSELKLQAQFLKVSAAYLTATPHLADNETYTNDTALTVTALTDKSSSTKFLVLRPSAYESFDTRRYKLQVSTTAGSVTIPQLGGALTLYGHDSKIHVIDYDVGGTNLLYSSAEIFTWKRFANFTVLILYGGPNELHEFAIASTERVSVVEGAPGAHRQHNGITVFQWTTSNTKTVLKLGTLYIYLLDRNSAYNYWVPDLSDKNSSAFGASATNPTSLIVHAGYLVRTAQFENLSLHVTADFNSTTDIEIIGAPQARALYINDQPVRYSIDEHGVIAVTRTYTPPKLNLPDLSKLDWKYIDGLPEIRPDYDDTKWVSANRQSNNTYRNQTTPASLYSSDYGFHAGYLIYRGHFVSQGNEPSIRIQTQGGSAFGTSAWLNGTYLGSFTGVGGQTNYNSTFNLTNLIHGVPYVLTVLVDNNGYDMNFVVGSDTMKAPRGILDYSFGTSINWKLTGNLGGEDYADKARGPLNEGGSYPERQGWHQPYPPSSTWGNAKPTVQGQGGPGLAFYTTQFNLSLPSGWHIPLSFVFTNTTQPPPRYRVQLFVNGWQFGKYINHIGPQHEYPVPEGILNYHGTNFIAVTLWSQQAGHVALDGLALRAGTPVETSKWNVTLVDSPKWTRRLVAY